MVNLFFSEYAEGNSSNKYLEIYNPTADTVDLSPYAFPSVANAPTTVDTYEYWNDFPIGAWQKLFEANMGSEFDESYNMTESLNLESR